MGETRQISCTAPRQLIKHWKTLSYPSALIPIFLRYLTTRHNRVDVPYSGHMERTEQTPFTDEDYEILLKASEKKKKTSK